jgi:hypothetical protein
MVNRLEQFITRYWSDPACRPWFEAGLIVWTLLMLGVILLALAPSTASKPVAKVATVGEVRPPEPVRPPSPLGREPPPVERVTFRERWSPVALPAMPATTVTPVVLVAPRPPQPVPEQIRIVPREIETPKNVKARDVCGRHGLRKVWVSDRRWRCRR